MKSQQNRHGRQASRQPSINPRRKLLALVVAAAFGTAQAGPVAPTVVHGAATFNQQGNLYSITNTPNTIIDWRSFSVNAGEITRFIQQGADSKVLNRITGQDPSMILGALQSNGKVFLINPNGVLFGAGSRVDVGGLVASSLAISNADFLAGKNHFSGGANAGKVGNQGSITTPAGGQIFLIAPTVENSGVISAPNGDVVLAAGHTVQLFDSSDPNVRVVLSAPADQALNLGGIVAQGGRVGVYGALVTQRGTINADSAVRGERGQILLKASGRTMLEAGSVTTAKATGVTDGGIGGDIGGDIRLLGEQVGLTGNAVVDASGAAGGGTVLVGGDYQGKNAALPNARQTFVGGDATISANATVGGDGGKVVVWSDEATRMHGTLSARGGAQGGNGGLVETSGHYLDVAGARVDAGHGKAGGKSGTWLLDPYNISVVNDPTSSTPLDAAAQFGQANSGTTFVDAALISAATANVVLQARHDLAFNADIHNTNNGVGLTAQAGNDINVNAALAMSGGVRLTANDNSVGTASGSGAVNVNGSVSVSAVGRMVLDAAKVTLGTRATVSGGNITIKANALELGTGARLRGLGDGVRLLITSDRDVNVGHGADA
ncbi:MAG TPA: filamentous hemagglutinin N-terminal domain-containing protein, partial [Duganella sp.]